MFKIIRIAIHACNFKRGSSQLTRQKKLVKNSMIDLSAMTQFYVSQKNSLRNSNIAYFHLGFKLSGLMLLAYELKHSILEL